MSDIMPSTTHVTVPGGFRKQPPAGVVLHRGRLTPDEVEDRVGYQVTTPLRTLIDVAAGVLSQEHLDRAMSDALERGLVRRRRVEEVAALPGTSERLAIALANARAEDSRL
jgi:hypothetical protein